MKTALELTSYWLEEIVLGLDLCPFAKVPFEKGLIRIVECQSTGLNEQIKFFLEELNYLNGSGPLDAVTSLIVYTNGSKDFFGFNDFVGELETLMEEVGVDSIFQLVVFHPQFVFAGMDKDEIGNWVNRSPAPTLHIVRSEDMTRAICTFKNDMEGEEISLRNEKKLKELSHDSLEGLFYYLKK